MANPLDIAAQQRGFHNYQAWQANQANQANQRQLWQQRSQNLYAHPGTNPNVAPQQEQPNFLMNLINKIPIHPSALLNYVNDKMKQAQQ